MTLNTIKIVNYQNFKRTITYLMLLLITTLSLYSNTSYAIEPDKKAVRFIYFIEKGERYDQKDYDAIKKQAFIFQKYWNDQFGGTFYLTKHVVDVVLGDHDADWYVGDINGDNRWTRYYRIRGEVREKIENHARVIVYPKAIRDGYVGANPDSAILDGDNIACIYNRDGKNTTSTGAHCLGHVAHEFGHSYGLGHVGETKRDCMRYGLYDKDAVCSFSQENRTAVVNNVLNSGWLDASPTETADGYKEYPYIADQRPQIVLPTDNTALDSTSQTFTWTANGADIEKYRVFIGSTKRGANYYKSPLLSADTTTITVFDLPTDGSNVHVRLKYKLNGRWYRHDYRYYAMNTTTPTLLSPVLGSTLTSDTETFTWTDNGVTVSNYKISVGSCKGCSDYHKSSKLLGGINSVTVTGLPTDGSTVYVKFIYVDSNSVQRHARHYTYTASEK
jgi:hypothetical protein